MESEVIDQPEHPVVDLARRLHCRLTTVTQAPVMSMTPQQKREALVLLSQGVAQLETLRLKLLAEAEQSEATVGSGAPTAADWVAVETRQVRRDARSDLKLAKKHGIHLELIYIPGGQTCDVTVVHEDSPDTYSVVAKVPTMRGARTITVNPVTHVAYVFTPEFGPAPTPAPGTASSTASSTPRGRGPRGPIIASWLIAIKH